MQFILRVKSEWRWEQGDGETKCTCCGDVSYLRQARLFVVPNNQEWGGELKTGYVLCASCADESKQSIKA